MSRNDFAESSQFYDVILGKTIEKSARFVAKQLKKCKVKTVLELGCGSGLYLAPLKKAGFQIEGLDISKNMLSVAKKKARVKLYAQDMSRFRTKKKYDAILCLNSSLVLLPDHKHIAKTLQRCAEHLNDKGLLLLDLPNHAKEIDESNFSQEAETYKLTHGKMDVVFRDYKKSNKWISEWHGFVKQGKKFGTFREYYEELIYSPRTLENDLKHAGFRVIHVFGSRTGGKFDPKVSYRRVYMCQKA